MGRSCWNIDCSDISAAVMSNEKRIITGYVPRDVQRNIHLAMKRFNVLVCHRRMGKTVLGINHQIDAGLRCQLWNPQLAYLAPTYGQAKRVAWEYFKMYTEKLPGRIVNESELRIDIARPSLKDHVRFMLLGAENPDSLRGMYLDNVLLDEFASMSPGIWGSVIRPTLSDRKGGATFLGTPKGQNEFYNMYQFAQGKPDWFRGMYKASETGLIDKEELEAARATMSREEYEQEYECSFTAALVGAYYGRYMQEMEDEGRITTVPHDPALQTYTFWDLGIGDTTAIWFVQYCGHSVHVIDFVENSGVGLEWYVSALREGLRTRYVYGGHHFPHDIEARELGTGRARTETLRELGLQQIYVAGKHRVEDGIAASRMLLPRCWMDKVKCARGIKALQNYQQKWDAKRATFLDIPHHDWASHAADAFRILAMEGKDRRRAENRTGLPAMAESYYDVFEGR